MPSIDRPREVDSEQMTELAPLEDPRRVNEYRAAAGFMPLDDDEIAAAWPDYP